AGEADEAEADEARHQHPGEDMVPDGDVGQGHARGYLVGLFFSRIAARRHVFSRIAAPRLSGAADGRWLFALVVVVVIGRHGTFAEAEPPVSVAGAVWTSIPSASRSDPSTTTLSPGVTPDRISTPPSPVRMPSCRGRTRALLFSTT